ncbi:putative pentatricopeptide repeat-containing protein At3g13770, mitochondrial [Zingiber officinale]|uniref:Pentatricopeptide repeat-containing protein n=1 Tax=Zingiber officinale TaxID=94328 RepID=A0A8J5LA87_ZINOF|nr:putative pentatricopeptide repeat-containing protein At3g13770, mitochondrial [Zingiber officinale]KAG6520407.1 hypothetical protein ZIOFF_017457 [Zingiber officinale]
MLEFGSTIFSSSVPPRATWSAEPRLSTLVVDYVACTVVDVGHRAAASTWRRPRDWLPDDAAQDVPFSTLFNCCASLGAVRPGRELHGYMIRRTGGNARTCCSESSLVSFYAKCGFMTQARKVFDQMPERDIVAWAVMLKAYADGGHYRSEMMHLFVEMLSEAIVPNSHTLSLMLSNATPDLGEQLHASAVKWALDSDAFVGSSLVDFYSRNGSLGLAQLLFDRIPQTDVVCYNCLISGYGRAGITEGIVSLYSEMHSKELMPNQSTFVGLLGGCAHSGLIGLSKQFHAQAIVQGFGFDEVVQVILVDMYAKCGDIESCRIAFDMSTVKQNVAIWNSLICGYGKHGRSLEALRVFDFMESVSVHPDHITFTCLLSACSHSGFEDDGRRLFCSMQERYGVPAREEHYSCMVDLFGRAGMVREAYELISRSACKLGPSVWGALLSACKLHGDLTIGEIAAQKLFELEPECSGSYIALSNIYSAGKQWREANAVRELMDERNISKDAGHSWIEVGGMVHRFRAGRGSLDHTTV